MTSGTQSPTLGQADRDGLRRARRCRAGYDARRRDPRAAGPRRGRRPAVLPPSPLTVGVAAPRPRRPVACRRPTPRQRGGAPAMVPDGPALHEGPRVGPRRRRRGDGRHHRTTPRTSSATSSSSSCPRSGSALEPVADVRRRRVGQGGQRPVRAGRRARWSPTNDALGGSPELVNSDPYGDGWMIRVKVADAGPARRPARRGRLRRADRGGLTADALRSPYRRRPGADARGPRHRLGRRALRRHPRGPAGLAARPAAARARARARRAADRARRAEPDRPRLVPGRRRLPPLEPARGRPAAAARRVVHGLHAVPARGQPGHAPEHLRVRVADRRAGRTSTWSRPRTTTARPPRPRPR